MPKEVQEGGGGQDQQPWRRRIEGDACDDDGGELGISAHTDFECFTLIHQSARGLQVQARDGRWLEIPAEMSSPSSSSSSFVVLIGDMLENWTNG